MLKKILIVLLCFLLTGSIFVGCSQNQEEPDKSASAVNEEQDVQKESEEVDTQNDAEGKILSTGPHGEKATSAKTLGLSDEEITKIKEGNYKVAVVLHYAGNDWSTAQVEGIKSTCKELGMEVVAVTDANFKVEKQVSDIETVTALNPDIIISIPTDPVATAPAYKKAAEQGIKLVFMDNTPADLQQGQDYVSVVSADNYGNGVVAAEIMAKELNNEGKIGVIFYDANFFVTDQRVEAFEKTINEQYPNIEIVDRGGFEDPNKVAEVADAMLIKNPDIEGIFAVWDVPAESVLASAKAAGRNDLVVTTIDLGNNAAREIASGGMLKGLGAQLPFDQGVAEVMLAAYALLEKEAPPYVAVPALKVTNSNVLDAYQTVYHKEAPDAVKEAAAN